MRTLIVGDVHGCAAELRSLVELAQPDRVVLVGDLYAKGPSPAGVWRMVRDGGWEAVLGNHDAKMVAIARGRRAPTYDSLRCIRELDRDDPQWIGWLDSRPLFLEVAGFTVVHAGLHPSGSLAATTREMALTMRWWPIGKGKWSFWYDVYHGGRRVVFGHDAMRGLVRRERDGVPWLVGLDSGCVYGGSLSGYLAEEDQIIRVEALSHYRPASSRWR